MGSALGHSTGIQCAGQHTEPLACLSPDALSVTTGVTSKSYMLWSWEVKDESQM